MTCNNLSSSSLNNKSIEKYRNAIANTQPSIAANRQISYHEVIKNNSMYRALMSHSAAGLGWGFQECGKDA